MTGKPCLTEGLLEVPAAAVPTAKTCNRKRHQQLSQKPSQSKIG
eukprot:COSAG06_NODE_7725_length_2398_cov_1.568508_1_plen_43_part_10